MAFDWSSIDIGVGDLIEKDDVALMKKNAEDLRDEFGVSWTWDHFIDCDSETDDGYPTDDTIKSEQPTELQNKTDTLDDAKLYGDYGTNNDTDNDGYDSTNYGTNNDTDKDGHESTDYSDNLNPENGTNYGSDKGDNNTV